MVWVLGFDEKKLGIKRDLFVKALNEEVFRVTGDMLNPYIYFQLFKEGRHLEEKTSHLI